MGTLMMAHGYFVLFQCDIPPLPHILTENKLSCDDYAHMIPKYGLPNTAMMNVTNVLVCNMHACQFS